MNFETKANKNLNADRKQMLILSNVDASFPICCETQVPPPWNETLPLLMCGTLLIPAEIFQKISPEYLRRNADEILAGLHWLLRLKWNSRYKVPGKRAFVAETKPTGKWLVALLDLCMEVHCIGTLACNMPYRSASEWFSAIIEELLMYGKQILIVNLYPPEEPEEAMQKVRSNPAKKRAELDLLNAACSDFRDLERPTQGVERFAFAELVSTAKCLAEQSDLFRKKTYMPFCLALRAMVKAMSTSNFASLGMEDGEVFEQKRGREKRTKR